ncbi:MAG: hypothetical protein K0Q87_3678 [Neobacillus sp.]|jgi:NADH:ubiquinone oxidoreductase subunit 3 (subunit A)|nr:hypothetical protein [Neobacillus sp.]
MKNEGSKRERFSRNSFALLAILFTFCIVAQVFLAGLAIFVNPLNWMKHTNFIHLFEFIPVIMFILSFVGNMPRWAIGQSAALFVIIFVMYFTANITPVLPWAAALHPVIAIGIFWMSIKLGSKSWKYAFKPQTNEGIVVE